MILVQDILLICSITALTALGIYAASKPSVPGSRVLIALIFSVVAWSIGSHVQMHTNSMQAMLFWRNFEQIGVFLTPLFTLVFSIAYTKNRLLRPLIYLAATIQAISLSLLFTDHLHHIMRKTVEMIYSPVYGNTLVIQSTSIVSLLVAFNFSLPVVSSIILFLYARSLAREFRSPLYWIIGSILCTFTITLLKATVLEELGVYLQMSVLYTPCVAVFCFQIYSSRILNLSPVARNLVFDVIDHGILVLDPEGHITDRNARASDLLKSIAPGNESSDSVPVDLFTASLEQSAGDVREFEKADSSGYVSVKQYSLGSRRNEPRGYVLVLSDITAQKNYEEQLRQRAEIDQLTGIYNRVGISRAYARLQQNPPETRLPVSMFLIDIDEFKNVNDAYGHLAGDVVLSDFAMIMRNMMYRGDILGRIGGDEFVVILPHVDCDSALHIAQRYRKFAERSIVFCSGKAITYTVSIGVADSTDPDENLETLMQNADTALYRAKSEGRNRCAAYTNNDSRA